MATMLAATAGALDFPILSMLIVVPAVGAVIITLLSKRRPEYMKLVSTASRCSSCC